MADLSAQFNLTVHGIGVPQRVLDPGEDGTWIGVPEFETVLDAVAGRSDVHLTFDDGNSSDLEIALPRLRERGITAAFYVLAGELGRPGRLTADGVRALVTAGMAVGSHGWAHRDWRRLRPGEAEEEFDRAPRVLADLVGGPVTEVAIPFGSYDRHVLRALRRTGVTRAHTSDGGPAEPGGWLQARTSVRGGLTAETLAAALRRPALPRRARQLGARAAKRVRG
ncbi:polysaccharide deacetylase [Actinocorallia herbida]|uniref:Polysaccharide deacetylase n=1 Tax=Actinocorallia herbida TaxID=58109 RepID=A0A3N1CPV1_9ACTN|nr:polysaccharide deacetylase family protein [Actinocorallia herbida]ROO82748.1 polysaccharide deacetylase [Actinocorallia herbida]